MKISPLLVLTVIALSSLGQKPNAAQEGGEAKDHAAPLAPGPSTMNKELLLRASQLELQGRFKEAARLWNEALAGTDLSAADRKAFEFELDRLERIKKCFPFSRTGLLDALRSSVTGLTDEEFQQWVNQGRFDCRTIDCERRFMVSSVRNLFFRYPELRARRRPPQDTSALERRYWESCTAIKKTAREQKAPYVLPKRFRVTMTVAADAGAAPAGEIVRAWLPLPRLYPCQGDFTLLSASPAATRLDDPESAIRCLYIERRARAGQATEFRIQYEFTRYAAWFNIDPEVVRPWDAKKSELEKFVREAAHVEFTPEMRELSRQIFGGQTNSVRKAKRIYDWIADRIKYSLSIEYSTIRNLGDYCRLKGYGDCGQEAFLFITLCRLNGIPARWQSGWNIFPGAKDIHDWSEIFLAPYGWVPVDPYMGVFAMRYATTLSPAQRRELRDFYFGGMDQYRMAANSDHCQALTPPKQSMRSDNVDFQRAELEYGSHNIYFDRFSYDWDIDETPPGPSTPLFHSPHGDK